MRHVSRLGAAPAALPGQPSMHSSRPVAADCSHCLALCLQDDGNTRYITITGCNRTPGKFRVTTFTANSRYSSGSVDAQLSTDGVGSYFYKGAQLQGAWLGHIAWLVGGGSAPSGPSCLCCWATSLAGFRAVPASRHLRHVTMSRAHRPHCTISCCRPRWRCHLCVQPQH